MTRSTPASNAISSAGIPGFGAKVSTTTVLLARAGQGAQLMDEGHTARHAGAKTQCVIGARNVVMDGLGNGDYRYARLGAQVTGILQVSSSPITIRPMIIQTLNNVLEMIGQILAFPAILPHKFWHLSPVGHYAGQYVKNARNEPGVRSIGRTMFLVSSIKWSRCRW